MNPQRIGGSGGVRIESSGLRGLARELAIEADARRLAEAVAKVASQRAAEMPAGGTSAMEAR